MSFIGFVITVICLFITELLYFRIADHYNIIDKPNHRSSHSIVTIRGGGIIFPLSVIACMLYTGINYPYFLIGLLAISAISFIDDIKSVSNKLRILIHLGAVGVMFMQLQLFSLSCFIIVLAVVFVIGTINAINFMDGINGITGGYALVALITLYYINSSVANFTSSIMLLVVIAGVVVFNFFNFRTKAKCFAGDVGSVSIAFIITFFVLQLIIFTNNLNFLLVLLVYGLDAGTTILFRLMRKENIFEAHRSHLYQFLANEKRIPHLWVSFVYMMLQIIVNLILVITVPQSLFNLAAVVFLSILIFVAFRLILEGPGKLMHATR